MNTNQPAEDIEEIDLPDEEESPKQKIRSLIERFDDLSESELVASVFGADHLESCARLGRTAVEVQQLKIKVKSSPLNTNDWQKAVKRASSDLESQRKGKERARALREAEERDLPTFHDFVDVARIAEALHDYIGAEGVLRYDQQRLWQYQHNKGTFQTLDESRVANVYQSWSGAPIIDGDTVKPLRVGGIDAKVKAMVSLVKGDTPDFAGDDGEGFFDNAPHGAAFENGFLRYDRSRGIASDLEPLSSEHRLRHRLDVAYRADEDWRELAPRFAEAIESDGRGGWFRDDPDREAKAKALQEFAGAVIFGLGPTYEKALFLIGEGGDGKSQFLKLIRALVPDDAQTNVRPQDMESPFMCARLAGARLNVCDEVPSRQLLDSDRFKNAVTGDNPIVAGYKHEKNFSFVPEAVHVFSGNDFPSVSDTSPGFWRRLMVVTWNRNFAADIANRERKFADGVLDAGELEGIAVWAVEGARRLIEQDGYTVPDSSAKFLDEQRTQNNSVATFIEKYCEPTDEYHVASDRLYRYYSAYCDQFGRHAFGDDRFYKELSRLGYDQKQVQRNKNRKMRRQLKLGDVDDLESGGNVVRGTFR